MDDKDESKSRRFNSRCTLAEFNAVERLGIASGRTVSEVVRDAVREYLAWQERVYKLDKSRG